MSLPASVAEIADVIGRDAALYLIGQLPKVNVRSKTGANWSTGRRVELQRVMLYVPKRLKPDHRLVQILGEELAGKLVDAFGGENLFPANCNSINREARNREAVRLYRSGMPRREIARIMAVSERTIANLTREIPQEEIHAANDNNPDH